MNNLRRKRTRLWKAILTTVTLGTTLPVLALLCRGHSPSRYDVANLPVWEQVTPTPPAQLGRVKAAPLPPANVKFASLPIVSTLLAADENNMFSNIEITGAVPPRDRLSAGKPGVWLEQAAAVGSWNGDLESMMTSVASRLMTAQDPAGYLGAVEPVNRYNADDISAHANNLRGLLSYYRLTRQPAALYSAIRAGDFLIDNYDPSPGNEEAGAEDGLVYALTRLYQACGDPKYLRFAEREEAARGCDGLGLCALYEATGSTTYLILAERAWKYTRTVDGVAHAGSGKSIAASIRARATSANPQFSAEIFLLTGDRRYLDGLRDYRATSVWPIAVAFTRGQAGLSINCLYPAVVRFGDVQLDIKSTLLAAELKTTVGQKLPGVDPPATNNGGVDIDPLTLNRAAQRPVLVERLGQTSTVPLAREADDIVVTTKAHVAPTVHIILQPGCVAAVEDRSVEISLNGKPVRYDGVMGSTLALRPVSDFAPTSTKPGGSPRIPSLKLQPAAPRVHGGPEA